MFRSTTWELFILTTEICLKFQLGRSLIQPHQDQGQLYSMHVCVYIYIDRCIYIYCMCIYFYTIHIIWIYHIHTMYIYMMYIERTIYIHHIYIYICIIYTYTENYIYIFICHIYIYIYVSYINSPNNAPA